MRTGEVEGDGKGANHCRREVHRSFMDAHHLRNNGGSRCVVEVQN